jgi:hypothetical protein
VNRDKYPSRKPDTAHQDESGAAQAAQIYQLEEHEADQCIDTRSMDVPLVLVFRPSFLLLENWPLRREPLIYRQDIRCSQVHSQIIYRISDPVVSDLSCVPALRCKSYHSRSLFLTRPLSRRMACFIGRPYDAYRWTRIVRAVLLSVVMFTPRWLRLF